MWLRVMCRARAGLRPQSGDAHNRCLEPIRGVAVVLVFEMRNGVLVIGGARSVVWSLVRDKESPVLLFPTVFVLLFGLLV
jgi:hypothetical protein